MGFEALRHTASLTAALALSLIHHVQEARAADESEMELVKKTQNPVADLISVPFQSNFNFNTGTKDATVYVLNVQPVIPIKLSSGKLSPLAQKNFTARGWEIYETFTIAAGWYGERHYRRNLLPGGVECSKLPYS